MKIYAISDLHMSINNPKPMDIFGPVWDNYLDAIFEDISRHVKQDDILIIAGDISWAMSLQDAKADLDLIAKQKGKKIIIRGNHDYWWSSISKVRSILPDDFVAIQNDSVKYENVIFCGTRGWNLPDFKGFKQADKKILDREIIRLELTLKEAVKNKTENDKIVCIMHYPPCNIKLEDSPFTKLLETYGISAVVFGHVHDERYNKYPLKFTKNSIKYYLTSCDLLQNKVVEIKL